MFDEGQKLDHPYHRSKFESEKLARTQTNVPWRVYRPAIVVGNSQTGEMDKIDGPYYFFGHGDLHAHGPIAPGNDLDLLDREWSPVAAVADDRVQRLGGDDRALGLLVDPGQQRADLARGEKQAVALVILTVD